MKRRLNLQFVLAAILAVLFLSASNVPGGRPGPPQRNPPGRRQANMLMLRFQDALAAGQWPEALSFCSDRVRARAADWPTPKDFFTETMPIEHLLARDFGCWSCGDNFFGMFVTLGEPDANPRIDWYWGIAAANGGWAVDYPPVKLDEYVAKKKAALQAREDRVREIRQSLEQKVAGVRTRLTPLNERFVLGAPMLFRVDLTNSGATEINYQDQGVQFHGLTVLNAKKEPIPHDAPAGQIRVRHGKLMGGASTVLAEKIDINLRQAITRPGKYFVQFHSEDVQVGEPVPSWEPGRFGENDHQPSSVFGLLCATNKFPSNLVEIEVHP